MQAPFGPSREGRGRVLAPLFIVAVTASTVGCAGVHGSDPAGGGGGAGGIGVSVSGQGGGAGTGAGTGTGAGATSGGGGDVGGDGQGCGQDLHAVVRDFRGFDGPAGPKHPDFEFAVAAVQGLVKPLLGADQKPVYAPPGPTAVTNGPDYFNQWYRDVDTVNIRFEITIPLTADPTRPGVFVYDSDAFFPIDDLGWGDQYQSHNFDFTTEIHFNFPYRGHEVFTFRGDDDVFVFVNGHQAIDLGGVHTAETGSVDLDQMAGALGITPGKSYQMDIFHAERHVENSTFHIETTLQCIDNIVVP